MLKNFIFLFFFIFSIGLSFIIFFLSYFFIKKQIDNEKLSSYECGFAPFDDARIRFDIRFYLVAILFIIFDLEIFFLFPWSISFHYLGLLGFFSMIYFLLILILGFIYEWNRGALDLD
jgi:NADH:ubiquinone oxidoreductase subunit 3 (subunit A)